MSDGFDFFFSCSSDFLFDSIDHFFDFFMADWSFFECFFHSVSDFTAVESFSSAIFFYDEQGCHFDVFVGRESFVAAETFSSSAYGSSGIARVGNFRVNMVAIGAIHLPSPDTIYSIAKKLSYKM